MFEGGIQIEIWLTRCLIGEGEPPDLLALRFIKAVEIGHKAIQQVGLGDQHINREMDPQLFMQLNQAFTQRAGLRGAGFATFAQQIGDADGHHHAVDRLTGTVFFQQADEAFPLVGVFLALAFLSGITTRGIKQHGVIGEPPVAVTGTAHTAQGRLAEAIRQRKMQAGVDQRGGFTGTRRTDDHIPRQLVEILAAEVGHPAVFAVPLTRCEAGFLQQLRRFIKALGQLLILFGYRLAVFCRNFFGGTQVTQQAAVEPGTVDAWNNAAQEPDQIDSADG
ncbi:hypothetical protein D3C80_1330210 [compost metagenome]